MVGAGHPHSNLSFDAYQPQIFSLAFETEASKNIIYLTISIPELAPDYTLDITSSHISFKGHSTPPSATATASAVEPKTYEFELDLFGEVEELKRTLTGKNLSLVLGKKELSEDYWPRLTKEKVKLNFLKTDFGKWKDQDEQEDEEPVEEAPQQQGPPGMGGMGGMGGAGGMGGMDMEALMAQMGGGGMGGAGGAGGAGGMDFAKMMEQMKGMQGGEGGEGGDAEEEEEDSDDDGPPPLEEA
ncbi:hypothetical protein P7C70_g3482, partial [Phenoliferia sp. Uapishka_3]